MQNIKELEKVARLLEPDSTVRREIIQKAADYADNFIENLPEAKGYSDSRTDKIHSLDIEEQGRPLDELLSILNDEVDTVGINSASGAHLGYIPGGGIWTSAVADMLAAATNRYAGVAYSSPGAVAIENKLIRWLCSLVGYPETAHGNLSSGGSISNLIAVKAARDYHSVNSKNVAESVIYVTGQVHHSLYKAFHTTGLHEAVLRHIPMNSHYQMDTEALKARMEKDRASGLNPLLVVATAGTTDTGAIDPLDSIADLCEEHEAWFHVDAAYGGFFLLTDLVKDKFKGIERSDSVVMDPHKTLFIPYGSGIVLVRDRKALLDSNSHKASYMQDTYSFDDISPADCGPELSKHFRGLRMWLPLHIHGLEPFRANLEEKVLLCRYFHEKVTAMGFQTIPDPQLSIALFRLAGKNNDSTQQLLDALHEDGRFFFSSTVIDNVLWIRCAVVSFRTHLREIKLALEMIRETVEKLDSVPEQVNS